MPDATALDLLQKQGRYPLPDRMLAYLGREVSGTIEACGAAVRHLAAGQIKYGASLSEGDLPNASANAWPVLPVPDSFTLEAAACLPEALFTVWISLVWQARLAVGETVLIHGGASGIGVMAIQMANIMGARVFATASTQEKCESCLGVGAARAIQYTQEDYVQVIQEETGGKGVDIILDMVGGDTTTRNLACLARGGRLCFIAFLKGAKAEVNLGPLLLRHLAIYGFNLALPPSGRESAPCRRNQRQPMEIP